MENYPVPSRFQTVAQHLKIDLSAQRKVDSDDVRSRVLFARYPDGRPADSKVYPEREYDEEQAFTNFLSFVETQLKSPLPDGDAEFR